MTERVLLDACVLYPTLLRQILIGLAEKGLYTPLWSQRILDEWRHAARRSGPVEATLTEGEISRLSAAFPDSSKALSEAASEGLSLPDPNDVHV
nr:PIN domain-containing protein [Dinoroseobacter sp.]